LIRSAAEAGVAAAQEQPNLGCKISRDLEPLNACPQFSAYAVHRHIPSRRVKPSVTEHPRVH
jgi:hypothetical protein